jgi:hypothetical protein
MWAPPKQGWGLDSDIRKDRRSSNTRTMTFVAPSHRASLSALEAVRLLRGALSAADLGRLFGPRGRAQVWVGELAYAHLDVFPGVTVPLPEEWGQMFTSIGIVSTLVAPEDGDSPNQEEVMLTAADSVPI